jgi:uncharacterized membrane protein
LLPRRLPNIFWRMLTGVDRYSRFAYSALVATASIVLLGSILGPRPAFALLCHQLPVRSFVLDGHLFAVCHRCTGLYVGLFVGVVSAVLPTAVAVIRAHGIRFIILSLLFIAADVGLDAVHILHNTPVSRVVTGFGLGLAGGLFITVAVLTAGTVSPGHSSSISSNNTLPANP